MELKVDTEKGVLAISIDLYEYFEKLTDEEKDRLADMLTWDRILDAAIRRLTGDAQDWAGRDKKLTLDVLTKMERFVLSGYKWSILHNLDKLAQYLTVHSHIYWKMYHEPDEGLRHTFHNWLIKNNINSNYTLETKNYQEFKKLVEDKLNEFGNALSTK